MVFVMVAESAPVTVVAALEIKTVAAVLEEKNAVGLAGVMDKKALMIIIEKGMLQDPVRVVEQGDTHLAAHAEELEECDVSPAVDQER